MIDWIHVKHILQDQSIMAAVSGSVGAASNTTLTTSQVAQTTNIGNLQDKIAIITGASSGLGRAIAQAYAAAGAYIVNADLKSDPPPAPGLSSQEQFKGHDFITPTVDLINSQTPSGLEGKPRAAFIQCNVTEPSSMEEAVAFAVRTYGRLDIMVNNAGISAEIGQKVRMHEQDVSILDKDLAVNVRGVWLGCKYAIGQMMRQTPRPSGERGWIINMCSIAGLIGVPNSSAYCGSKGAVLQITKSLGVDYAKDQIHVNCINPGFAETSMLELLRGADSKAINYFERLHPWGRLAVPEDIAKMAVFLAGEGASFVTGAAFVVDGGYTAQ